MRRRNILIGTLAIAVVVATIGGVAYALHTRVQAQADGASYPGLHAPVSVVCPGPTHSTTGQGGPGIRPRNECTPSFTQQDVRDYLAHGVNLGKIGVAGQPTITRVVFLTIGDLGRASGDSEWEANYPGVMLVCYAGLSGTFSMSGPPSGLSGGTPHSTSSAFIVFDARTGNQLVMGTGAPLG
jgi:hypothetical protein